MNLWAVQLLTLLGVALGALASFVSTRMLDRSRWQREEALRWDVKRLEAYVISPKPCWTILILDSALASASAFRQISNPLILRLAYLLWLMRNQMSVLNGKRFCCLGVQMQLGQLRTGVKKPGIWTRSRVSSVPTGLNLFRPDRTEEWPGGASTRRLAPISVLSVGRSLPTLIYFIDGGPVRIVSNLLT
jgi:hypothetical protein